MPSQKLGYRASHMLGCKAPKPGPWFALENGPTRWCWLQTCTTDRATAMLRGCCTQQPLWVCCTLVGFHNVQSASALCNMAHMLGSVSNTHPQTLCIILEPILSIQIIHLRATQGATATSIEATHTINPSATLCCSSFCDSAVKFRPQNQQIHNIIDLLDQTLLSVSAIRTLDKAHQADNGQPKWLQVAIGLGRCT